MGKKKEIAMLMIHVDKLNVAANKKDGASRPTICVHQDLDGEIIGKFHYVIEGKSFRTNVGGPVGEEETSVWIETDESIIVGISGIFPDGELVQITIWDHGTVPA